ncbi:MAG: OmpA family protein [Campylobacteraceae bacterium]|jgi:OOP family OmpA-OmpF porin|nr:OmpA family protein [Campylobacteraceae bacterium]
MKKVVLGVATSMALAYAGNSEIAIVAGKVDPMHSHRYDKHTAYGVRVGVGLETALIDQIELGYDYSSGVEYRPNSQYLKNESALHRLYFNVVKELEVLKSLKFYTLAGLGYEILHKDLPQRSRAFGQYGAGLKFYFTDNLAIRGEVRQGVEFSSPNRDNIFYTVGFVYSFGGKQQEVVQAEPQFIPAPVVEEPAPVVEEVIEELIIVEEPAPVIEEPAPVVAEVVEEPAPVVEEPAPVIEEPAPVVAEVVEEPAPVVEEPAPVVEEPAPVVAEVVEEPAPVVEEPEQPTLIAVPAPIVESSDVSDESDVTVESAPPALIQKSINFDTDSSHIKDGAKATLQGIADDLQSEEYLDVKVLVKGHADATGSDLYNLKLSQRRANAVKNELVKKGVAGDRITTRGYGEIEPIAPNSTKEGRAANRRAEIIFQ